MRSRRALAASTVAAALAAWMFGGISVSAGDGGDDDDLGDKNSLLAEAHFQLFLLTSGFVPTDITCTNPPVRDAAGELLCYALISDRVSVAAIAVMASPGQYTFVPLNKVDPADLVADVSPSVEPEQPEDPAEPGESEEPGAPEDTEAPEQEGASDQAVLDSIAAAVADAEGLGSVLTDNNPAIVSVDLVDYHSPTSTVQVTVTTDVTDPTARDTIAFFVTDVMAFLWAEHQPTRADGVTIHPRLEVTVDDVIYGTPFDVMTRVADYSISEGEWLEIVTTNAAAHKPLNGTTKSVAKLDGKASSAKPAGLGAT
jgi:hypothetical protein